MYLGTDFLARHRINLDFGNRVATDPTIGRINSSDNLYNSGGASSCPIHEEFQFHPEPYLQIASMNQMDERDWECLETVPSYDQSPIIDFPDTNKEIIHIIEQFRELFSSVPGVAVVDPFPIRTGETAPVKVPPRMILQAYQQEMTSQIKEMLNQNIIKISSSPWLAPPVLIKKKTMATSAFVLIIEI